MTLPVNEPNNERVVTAKTASVASSPVAAYCVAPVKGRIARTYAVIEGAIIGTAAIAVAINGGASFGALAVAAGGAGTAGSDAPPDTGGQAEVQEGDVISFMPSGATGASIPATFHAVIRKF
jgi:hypothetical protein